jgi:serine phosphatase RsbU (regulator of sigma subunit)
MASEIREKQHHRHEMQAAADIQKSILPGPLPREGAGRRVDLHAEMHPAREVGGDFYDFFLLEDNWLAITVGDVAGKGIPAALFMAVSRTVLRGAAGHSDMPARLSDANRLLAAENDACMFVTIFHGVLDLSTGVLRYCNAGHNPPYLLRAEGRLEALRATGIPFGIDPGTHYLVSETVLRPGDGLMLFSDGITEAVNQNGETYGSVRLEEALAASRGQSAAGIVTHVLGESTRFAAGAEQTDDITCLALFYRL